MSRLSWAHRLTLVIAITVCSAATPAHAADATKPARYQPAGWPVDFALPDNGKVRLPGDSNWATDDTGEFVWEIPDADAGDSIMLYRITGTRLPATTPPADKQSDLGIVALLTGAAEAAGRGWTVKLEDAPRLVVLGPQTWVRVQCTYGDRFLNRNGIVYLSYADGRYYTLVAEYQFVIDAGLVDAESSTSGDAEDAFQAIISPVK